MNDTPGKEMNTKHDETIETNDWFLELLVDLINKAMFPNLYITLNVGGVLISGVLVNGKQYFDEVTKNLVTIVESLGAEPDIIKMFEEQLSPLSKVYKDLLNKDKEEKPPVPIHYIHLKNVQFFVGDHQKPIHKNPAWWRGRVSKVDGFMIGKMEVREEQTP